MKWLIYLGVIAAALLIPVDRTDVGKLQPVEAVAIYQEGERVVVKTELGDMGSGKTVAEALINLKETAPGIVYLDTAEYLLVEAGAEQYIPELDRYLKDEVRICRLKGDVDLGQAVRFLDIHKPNTAMSDWDTSKELDILHASEERYYLEKKE